jgi:LysR family transcriptional activator of nhaA
VTTSAGSSFEPTISARLSSSCTNIRRALDQWFDSQQIRPFVVGQFGDFALMRRFGETGAGIFAAPSVLEKRIRKQGNLRLVGRAEAVRNRCDFRGTNAETSRVVAICETVRHQLFS